MAKIVENALVIYTDGSCHPKGRRGGFGILFLYFDNVGNELEIEDYVAPSLGGTTNQRMELEACVTALKMAPTIDYYTQANCVVIRTDSRYVVDYYISALTHWRENRWHNRAGKAVDNADLWKQFVKNYEKIPKRKQIEWVKGHGKGLQKDPHNYTADRLADQSARSPLRRSEYRSSVRRKRSPKETEIGSIQMHGQQLSIHVIETMWLRVQKKWKYRCEVISTDSPYFECVDWVYSLENLRDGHEYVVRLNDDQKNPAIVEMLRELQSTDDD